MNRFIDKKQAGKVLAELLKQYVHQSNVIVLALPRGGVPVAYEIAKILDVPLDVIIVRKLSVPGHEELAFGAVASGGAVVFSEAIAVMANQIVCPLQPFDLNAVGLWYDNFSQTSDSEVIELLAK